MKENTDMNGCTNIKTNITNNDIFSNYKSLIRNLAYYNYSPCNLEPTSSYLILDPSTSNTCLLITTHCVNI